MPDGSESAAQRSFEPRRTFPAWDEVLGGGNPDLYAWLENRRKYNARGGGLYRVHDGLYDLTNFEHPGGNDWLELMKGADITELFEAHHVNIEAARAILKKYYVRDADWPRESPITFEPDGFYSVLRGRVFEVVKKLGNRPKMLSKAITDSFAALYLGLSLAAAYRRSVPLAAAAGLFAGMLGIASHNFIHQRSTRENWRRFYPELTGGSHVVTRIHHALSHHIYPNTSLDVEIPMFTTMFRMNWLLHEPRSKNSMLYDIMRFYFRLITMGPLSAVLTPLSWILGRRIPKFFETLTYLVLSAMILARRRSALPNSRTLRGALETAGLYLVTRALAPCWTLTVGLTVGHYSDDVWRQGETVPKEEEILDFGLLQIETVGERKEYHAPETDLHLLIVLMTLGDHGMHHLFPALDHGYHRHLYPALAKTCNEFGVRFEFVSQLETFRAFFRQLKRTDPIAVTRRVGYRGDNQKGWVDEWSGFLKDPRIVT
ncbi:hypothetical protein DFJ74DRAFT_25962 [Hyaloraphidium curvatum]|nr:hypothetical protein DFJ74DRAFT_25962 [Hyaloraphidium curvatum]